MSQNRLQKGDIEIGSPILFDTFDQKGRLLLCAGQTIRSENQLERLLEWGMYGDPDAANDAGGDDASGTRRSATTWKRLSVFDLVAEVKQDLESVLTQPDADLAQKILALAGRVCLICELDADAALASMFHDRSGRYSIRHSVSTAILSAVIAQNRPVEGALADSTVAAALTMNCAILDFLDLTYSQAGPLDDAQKSIIRSHTEQSSARLLDLGVNDDTWLTIVRQHHEAHDGSGFPSKLTDASIHPLATIVAAAERYCATIIERAYRPGAPPDAALDFLIQKNKNAIHPDIAEILRLNIGPYPPGTVVVLANGDTAIAVKRTLSPRQPVAEIKSNLVYGEF